jgi:8-oxo-dGTP pyrophosphatase MutT (NUDIX family)
MTRDRAALPLALAQRLQSPLPGRSAQARFEPELAYGRHFGPAAFDARPAAVLMLLYRDRDEWRLPLALRPETLATHAGQIGLPGGRVELGETSHDAALRELQEELGVPADQVRLIGPLTPLYLFVTNFHIIPWLAWMDARPDFSPSSDEVAAVLELPIAALRDRTLYSRHRRQVRGLAFSAPCVCWQGHEIWGATAMMLGELTALLDDAGL